jgi:hypothetical protein
MRFTSNRASSKRYLLASRQALTESSAVRQNHFLQRFLFRLRSGITFKRFVLAVAVSALIIFLTVDSRRSILVLDPMSAPKQYSDAGISSEVMAQRVRERMIEIQRTRENSPRAQIQESSDQTMPDIEIPEANISVHTIEDTLRKVFHTEARHISVDFAYFDPTGLATIRCRILKGDEIVRSGQPAQLQLNKVQGISEQADRVAELMAERITEITDPYLEGMYLLENRQTEAAELLAVRMLGDWPDVEHGHAKAV